MLSRDNIRIVSFTFLIIGPNIFISFSAAMKSKSAEVKEKLFEYIVNPTGSSQGAERHVKSSDKVGRRYRNMAPVFSIDDDAGMYDLRNEIQL